MIVGSSLSLILLLYISILLTMLVVREWMGWNVDRKLRSVFKCDRGVIEASSTTQSTLPPPERVENVGVEGVSWGREVEMEELERDDMLQEEKEFEMERKMREEKRI